MRTLCPLRAGAVGVVFATMWMLPRPVAAETYHVAPGGSDNGLGTVADPWRTLQHAADQVNPGDTVEVAQGHYRGFSLERSGTEGEPIRFRAADGVVIDEDNPSTPDGINLEGVSDVVVEGFTIRGVTRAGIRAAECDRVTVRDNVADESGRWGIFTSFCDDLVIEDNETSRSADEHGIYVSNSGDRPVIRGNHSWGNRANGIHMNGDIHYGGDGLISDALVEGNVIHGNGAGGGSAINCDGVQDSIFRNNLLYDNRATGIALYSIDGAEGSKDNLVVNNTIVMPGDNRWAVQIRDGSTGNAVFNNVLINRHAFRGSISIAPDSLEGFVADHNIGDRFSADDGDSAMPLAAWQSETGQGQGSLAATPEELFVDWEAGDYHLLATSPAIDAGAGDFLAALDLDGNSRVAGAAVDIGAYELCEAGGCQSGDGGDDASPGDADDVDEVPPAGDDGDVPGSDGSDGSDGDDPAREPGTAHGCSATGASSPLAGGLVLALIAVGGLLHRGRRRLVAERMHRR